MHTWMYVCLWCTSNTTHSVIHPNLSMWLGKRTVKAHVHHYNSSHSAVCVIQKVQCSCNIGASLEGRQLLQLHCLVRWNLRFQEQSVIGSDFYSYWGQQIPYLSHLIDKSFLKAGCGLLRNLALRESFQLQPLMCKN